jgi:hypothetical protein
MKINITPTTDEINSLIKRNIIYFNTVKGSPTERQKRGPMGEQVSSSTGDHLIQANR